MKHLFTIFAMVATFFSTNTQQAFAAPMGKIEIAPAYIHLDVIVRKNTVKELDMPGVRGDLSYVTEQGWTAKATAIYGKESNGKFTSGALSFGRTIPVKEQWFLTPSIGLSYTNMHALIQFDAGPLGKVEFLDKFEALAPYLAIEAIYNFKEHWRLCASYQYSWSHPHTNIKKLFSSKSSGQGPSYGLLLEYDINKQWSVNFGLGYNESFSHEKDGLRARGIKLGLARWF